jgi:hypothetical protein
LLKLSKVKTEQPRLQASLFRVSMIQTNWERLGDYVLIPYPDSHLDAFEGV